MGLYLDCCFQFYRGKFCIIDALYIEVFVFHT